MVGAVRTLTCRRHATDASLAATVSPSVQGNPFLVSLCYRVETSRPAQSGFSHVSGARLCATLLLAASLLGCHIAPTHVPESNWVAARQWMLQGLEASQRGDWLSAEERLDRALQLAPDDERIHYHLSRVHWQQGRRQEALQEMAEAVRLSGDSPYLLVELGRLHLWMGRPETAEALARRALRRGEPRAAAHALLGDALRQQGQLQTALEHYHRSLDLDPYNPDVRLAVADIYRVWQEPWRILATLSALPRHNLARSQQAWLCYLEGTAYRQLQRYDDALTAWRQAVMLDGSHADWFAQLAELERAVSDVARSRENERAFLSTNAERSGDASSSMFGNRSGDSSGDRSPDASAVSQAAGRHESSDVPVEIGSLRMAGR